MTFPKTEVIWAGITVILTAAFDIALSPGYGEWGFYIIPILVLSGVGNEVLMISVTVAVSILSVAHLFVFSPEIPFSIALANRLAADGVFWIAALIIMSRNRAMLRERESGAQRNELQDLNLTQKQELETQRGFTSSDSSCIDCFMDYFR